MPRALSNHHLRESAGPADPSPHEVNRPLGPLARAAKPPAQDWLAEFPPEAAGPSEPAMWVEVPHARVAAPPHTSFHPFSPAAWIRNHRSMARASALALIALSAVLLGVAWWMQREPRLSSVTQSAASDPLLTRPVVTPPPAPPTVFTSEAATSPSGAAIVPPPARGSASGGAEQPAPTPSRASVSRDRVSTPPARVTAAPPLPGVTGATSGRAAASSSPSRGFVPPLPAATPPPRTAEAPPPPPATDASSSSSATITTSRPPVDRTPLILSPAPPATPIPTPTPAPVAAPAAAPPPLSPEARETAAVENVLERYRLAFSTLNSGVADFWPGVNSRALDKAFNELDEQRFEFDQCRVQLKGGQADATCTGRATFVPKVGDKTPRTQSRQWSFRLVRAGNRWIIDTVQVR